MCRNDTGAMSVMRPITVLLLAVLLCGGGALVEAARPSHTTPPPAPPLPAADAMTSPATSSTTTAHTPTWVDDGGWESFSGWEVRRAFRFWVDCQNGGDADGDCAM
jgi:hypothetical protein